MLVKKNSDLSEIMWIESIDSKYVPELENKNARFYKKCILNGLTLVVGDCVLVSNTDAAEPDTVDGCDVARILHLYELTEVLEEDPHRAIVQWFSRPKSIPRKKLDSEGVHIDTNWEIIEDHRPYDTHISLKSVFRKCSVVVGCVSDFASKLVPHINSTPSLPVFLCRYKYAKVKQCYKLLPLQSCDGIQVESAKLMSSCRTSLSEDLPLRRSKSSSDLRHSKGEPSASQKNRIKTLESVEFVNVNEQRSEKKVSPIKIIGRRRIVRSSSSGFDRHEGKANHIVASPLAEESIDYVHLIGRQHDGCRRENSITDEIVSNDLATSDIDCLNYSAVETIIPRQRSTELASLDEPCTHISEDTQQFHRKRLILTENDITELSDMYKTPTKKSKDGTYEMTPFRRRSILKSASSKLDGTPKRSIHLSDIVEERTYINDEIIYTPKRGKPRHLNSIKDECDEGPRGKKKTPVKERSSTKSSSALGDLTPTLFERQTPSKSNLSKSSLQAARESLHVSVIPTSLPCRENEFKNIYTFVEGRIQDKCGGCMYVSGVPGTGKTATVTGVIRLLQRQAAEGILPEFEFIEINGMRLTEPLQAYVHIHKQLTGKTLSWEHAHSLLDKRFSTPAPRRVTTVLLVDELDILCNRRQDVVYNLLDWPGKSSARLVVVTIANTMDLPERLLIGKVTSRLGLTRLTFQPYTYKQLQEIVTARLGCNSEAFKSDALQLVARKVAAVSGDARRALDICRRATEIADNETKTHATGKVFVNMTHVQQALSEMIASTKVQAIKNCSRMEQIFLQAVVAEITRTGVEETSFMGIYTQMKTIAAFMGAEIPSTARTLRICSKLGSQRLVISEHSRNDVFQKILLNISTDDIHYALTVNNT